MPCAKISISTLLPVKGKLVCGVCGPWFGEGPGHPWHSCMAHVWHSVFCSILGSLYLGFHLFQSFLVLTSYFFVATSFLLVEVWIKPKCLDESIECPMTCVGNPWPVFGFPAFSGVGVAAGRKLDSGWDNVFSHAFSYTMTVRINQIDLYARELQI